MFPEPRTSLQAQRGRVLGLIFPLKKLNAVRGPEIWTPWPGSEMFFSLLSKRFAQNCLAQASRSLVDNTDRLLPVIVMQMLMDSEVL